MGRNWVGGRWRGRRGNMKSESRGESDGVLFKEKSRKGKKAEILSDGNKRREAHYFHH